MKVLYHEIVAFSERHSGLFVLFLAFVFFVISNLLTFLGYDALSWFVVYDHELGQLSYHLVNSLIWTFFFLLFVCFIATLRLLVYYVKEAIEVEKKYWKNK